MIFAHLADVHLGGWRYPELQELNLKAFKKAIEICIEKKVNFVVISGDLFENAVPPVDVLKEAVSEFRRLKEANIPCYIVPGSHDYSVTGKTFIEVLEKAGLCKNVALVEEKKEKTILNFFYDKKNKVLLAGIPGKKVNLEIEFFKNLEIKISDKFKDFFKIFVFHTTLTEMKPIEEMPSISISSLPAGFDYYAGGHLHLIDIRKKENALVAYPGPLFPNNIEELEKLRGGNFFIVEYKNKEFKIEKQEIFLKDVISLEVDVSGLPIEEANLKIIREISKLDLKDKIFILRIVGCLSSGKTSEIDFENIKEKSKNAYLLLKNTSKLSTKDLELEIEAENKTIEELEKEIIELYNKQIPEEFKSYSRFILPLLENINFEKSEEEKKQDFEKRVIDSICKILNINFENDN
ncbi:MAG: DNA repair exonuclease [Candidatus Pacearchaeota archaeon]|nr:DNA repair exonuclease [Candidatus Pacearchaeota archaeon]